VYGKGNESLLDEKTSIRAVIWDVGGVLVRTENQAPRQGLAQRFGLTRAELNALVFDSEVAIRATLGEIPEDRIWQMVAQQLNIPGNEMPLFIDQFWAGDCFDRELYDFIASLRLKYKTGLLSNAWSWARQNLDQRFHILDIFDVLIFSAEVKLAKPDPCIYHYVLEKLGVSAPEAIFVDDVPENITAAKEVGLHAMLFENSLQARQDVTQLLSAS
jgi:epoxide hydrolase-like predicted phosphatase